MKKYVSSGRYVYGEKKRDSMKTVETVWMCASACASNDRKSQQMKIRKSKWQHNSSDGKAMEYNHALLSLSDFWVVVSKYIYSLVLEKWNNRSFWQA